MSDVNADIQQLLHHLPGLRRYARALTGDTWAADDLVQDTLERACDRWRLWLVGSDLRAWLFTLMHNIYLNGRRSPVVRHNTVPLEDVEGQLPGTETRHDEMLDLQRCLLLLPDEQRCVLLLVGLEAMSYTEVAKVLGVPVGTVMSRLSRARGRLRELMDAPPRPSPHSNAPVLRRLK